MPDDSISRMDSNSDANATENILGTSPGASSIRSRTDSESSEKMARFILPSMDGSPPKVLTLNEVADVVKNIQNMELAHEIALNPEFKLQPYEPPEDSLERRIKEVMHKAFWDLLREELSQTPPCYINAIQLLGDIKECFPQILSPNNKRALDHINEVLDETLIHQQAEKGVLDFKSYATFVIDIMAKSCAPARDDAVRQLTTLDDVVETFKGILDTMTLMKLDMANFLLDHARREIMANSVEYEKAKFKEYLEYYKFGFPATENWLQRNRKYNANNEPCTADQTISNAYMELMFWNENNEFPEVLSMDKDRILKLGQSAERLCVCASLLALTSAVKIIEQKPDNRRVLAQQIDILMQNVVCEKDITETLESVWVQIKKVINECLENTQQPVMDETFEQCLKTEILKLNKKDAPVRALMRKRLEAFMRVSIIVKQGIPPPPPGYVDFAEVLSKHAIAWKRIIAYNHSVFGDYLKDLLEGKLQNRENTTAVGIPRAENSMSEDIETK